MAKSPLPSPEVLRQLLRYDPETGFLFWMVRGVEFFNDSDVRTVAAAKVLWNAKHAGKMAFTARHNGGYKVGRVLGAGLLAHRVIWAIQTGAWPVGFIDHIDRDKENNQWTNLREASHVENSRNCSSARGSTSKFLGVCWHARRGKWLTQIRIDGEQKRLGHFVAEVDAALAYDAAARNHHGVFANLNFPEA